MYAAVPCPKLLSLPQMMRTTRRHDFHLLKHSQQHLHSLLSMTRILKLLGVSPGLPTTFQVMSLLPAIRIATVANLFETESSCRDSACLFKNGLHKQCCRNAFWLAEAASTPKESKKALMEDALKRIEHAERLDNDNSDTHRWYLHSRPYCLFMLPVWLSFFKPNGASEHWFLPWRPRGV